MRYFDVLVEDINRGQQGLNVGLPFGFPRLTEYVPNIQQGTYYSIGGEAGSGKTALVDNMFVLNPIKWYLENKDRTDIKIKILYFSFEVTLVNKIAKFAAWKLYDNKKILVDINYIKSRANNKIDENIKSHILKLEKEIDVLESIVQIYDTPINPTGISKIIQKFYDENGKYEKVDEYTKKYVPNNPNLYVIGVFDHIGLTKKEQGFNKKETLDKLSEYCVYHRNKHNFIPVAVSQFNRSLADAERQLKLKGSKTINYESLRPQQSDWKDTGAIGEDANVMIGLFSPNRYEIPCFDGYEIGSLEDRFRSINVPKARDGVPDISLGLAYLGEIGLFKELPKADDMMIKSKETGKNFYQTINDIKKYVGEDNSEGKQNSLF